MSKKRKRKSRRDFSVVLHQFEHLLDKNGTIPLPIPKSFLEISRTIPDSIEERTDGRKDRSEVERLNSPTAAIFLEQVQNIFLRRIRESKER